MTQHTIFHKDGSIYGIGPMVGQTADGYWEWYRKDGSKMRTGYFTLGKQTGQWTTYAKDGRVVKVTTFKS